MSAELKIKKIGEPLLSLCKMKNFLITVFTAPLILMPFYAIANEAENNSKSISFDKILMPNNKKIRFRINTIANKEDVQLEFEAMKLSGGKYEVYKTNSCELKNFSSDKLEKLSSKDLFFSFTTKSGNIFEERKIDFRTASRFNLGIYSFVLVKQGSPKTAVVCFSQ